MKMSNLQKILMVIKKYVYISFDFEMKNNPDMLLSGFVRSTW